MNHKKLAEFAKKNKSCACCANKNPQWAVLDWGLLICIECAGIIRSNIGTHICYLRSITLDHWKEEQVNVQKQFFSHNHLALYKNWK